MLARNAAMNFFLSLLRALTTPDGSDGELLSLRRKFHLLHTEWHIRPHTANNTPRSR
jgi:hypothetical protein